MTKYSNKYFIPMTPKNVEKILNGEKTTTIRSERAARAIGIDSGKTVVALFAKKPFLVTNRGLLTVQQAGGKETMWESEGFSPEGPMFKQTREWLNGKGKLYVYDIVPITGQVEQTQPYRDQWRC